MANILLVRLWDAWERPWPASRRWTISLVIGLLLYCSATVCLGALHTNIFGVDYFIFLDSGWRILTGQRPHTDFHTAQGPILALYSALAMWVGNGNINLGFGIVRGLVAGIFAVWCFALLRGRVAPVPTVLACLMVTLLAGAPFALTSSPFTHSMAMFYNRYGYVLLALILFEGFQSITEGYGGGFSTGLAAGILLFFKISFFGAALGFITLSVVVHPTKARRMAGLLAGLLAVTTAFLIWLRFDVAAILYDFHSLAVARSIGFPFERFLRILNTSLLGAALTVCLGLVVAVLAWNKRSSLVQRLEPLGIALLAVATEPLVAVSNQQDSVLIIMSVCCLVLLTRMAACVQGDSVQGRSLLGAILLLGLCLPAPGIAMDLFGFGSAVMHELAHRGARNVPRLDTPEFSSLIFEGELPGVYKYESGSPLVKVINDGIRLLRANTGAADRVLTLGFVNPFPAILHRPAPRGSAIWFGLNFNVSFPDNFPPPQSMFADVNAIMVPNYLSQGTPTTDALAAKYSDVIKADFVFKAKSDFWSLYTRRVLHQ